MKFLLFFFLLFPQLAFADWVLYNISKDTTMNFYYDKNSVVKKNNIVEVTEVISYAELNSSAKDGLLSIKVVKNFDCANVTERIISMAAYDRHMARGKLIRKESYKWDWKNILPNSISYTLFSKVCW